MDFNEKYFISLISSYLNKQSPSVLDNDTDWTKIYELSAIHNVSAIVANQAMLIKQNGPDQKILSKFRQQMGYTVIDATEKEEAISFIRKIMKQINMDFMFIKGAILRNYYPIKEFRTGSDIDVIVRNEDFIKCKDFFKNKEFKLIDQGPKGFSVYRNNQHIEIHSTYDCDNPFFINIFNMADNAGNEYFIKNEYHLLYVMCHIIKHFNNCGAGIKMFMDIDAIIRNTYDFDYDRFIDLCKSINIETFAKASFSLCSYWFNTPVKSEFDFNKDSEFRELFEKEIIESGNFGFNSRDLGAYYINKGIGSSDKNGITAKIKALFIMAFPGRDIMADKYKYLNKMPFLLPLAWISRIFAGAFKRTTHSKKTIRSIISSGKELEQYKKLLNELNI